MYDMRFNKLDKLNKRYKVYAEYLEHGAIEQFISAMEQDFVLQGALMPDAHQGYSLPIGAVVSTDNFVVPAWVGYDIGCGMCALPTTFIRSDIEDNGTRIFNDLYAHIPVGTNRNPKPLNWLLAPHLPHTKTVSDIYAEHGEAQLGTLGGGNHFIEIGYDESDTVWIVIHSGSRKVGHSTATHYMKLASGTNKAKEGHYGFNTNSDNGRAYLDDLNFCLEFALANRKEMISRSIHAISKSCYGEGVWDLLINRNHNHAELVDGSWIHRKGATHAESGMMGVIPGNMRDGSFIVRGLGNPNSLASSSHGAGRVLSRRRAKEELNLEDFSASMEGVVAQVGVRTLDESPKAYKNIFEVMELQKDLVDTIHHIKPLVNIKG